MSKIQVLDPITIDKIAAGEVIERPASVVKELVENAIDAGATAVVVEIKEGGISFMRITDNGCGIDRDDVRSAFLRHSTSKIRSVDDLVHIGSLGFRGEALIQHLGSCTGRTDHQDQGPDLRHVIPYRRRQRGRLWKIPVHRTERPLSYGSCSITLRPEGSF